MDLKKIGAIAAQGIDGAAASKSARVERDAAKAKSASTADVVQTSTAADAVGILVHKAKSFEEVRSSVVEGYRQLLGKGLLDSRAAAEKAASAIVG